jgi:hypothetical protein
MGKRMKKAKKLYQQGLYKFSQGDFQNGIKDFISSSSRDYIPASKEIGLCYLHGIGLSQNLPKAIKYFKKSKNNSESQFELSKLYYFGYGLKRDYKKSQKYLVKAVKQNYCPAINLMAMAYQVGNKTKKSQKLFCYNLTLNDFFAKHLNKLGLLKKKSSKIKFVSKFKWPNNFISHSKDAINSKPDVFQISNLLSTIECDYIKYISSPYMRESMTVDPSTGQHVKDEIRTSFSAAIDWLTEDPVINLIIKKCTSQFGVSQTQSEVMHVLHYSVGQEYKPHYDFFGGVDSINNFNPNQQRIKTICLYLNDVEQGGETSFPRLNKSVMPEKGKVAFFENIDLQTDQPYLESLHAGQPVLRGEKWLATLWIRPENTNRGPTYESI